MEQAELKTAKLRIEPRLLTAEYELSAALQAEIAEKFSAGFVEPALVVDAQEEAVVAVQCSLIKGCVFLKVSPKMTQFLKDNYGLCVGGHLLSINAYAEQVDGQLEVHPLLVETLAGNPAAVAQAHVELGDDVFSAFATTFQSQFVAEPQVYRHAAAHRAAEIIGGSQHELPDLETPADTEFDQLTFEEDSADPSTVGQETANTQISDFMKPVEPKREWGGFSPLLLFCMGLGIAELLFLFVIDVRDPRRSALVVPGTYTFFTTALIAIFARGVKRDDGIFYVVSFNVVASFAWSLYCFYPLVEKGLSTWSSIAFTSMYASLLSLIVSFITIFGVNRFVFRYKYSSPVVCYFSGLVAAFICIYFSGSSRSFRALARGGADYLVPVLVAFFTAVFIAAYVSRDRQGRTVFYALVGNVLFTTLYLGVFKYPLISRGAVDLSEGLLAALGVYAVVLAICVIVVYFVGLARKKYIEFKTSRDSQT